MAHSVFSSGHVFLIVPYVLCRRRNRRGLHSLWMGAKDAMVMVFVFRDRVSKATCAYTHSSTACLYALERSILTSVRGIEDCFTNTAYLTHKNSQL